MQFRTPRRRISPRTKRRVRAIKEFFKKTLGTSQTNSKTNSSIIISVSDLKSKIDIIEQQLDKVSKHCRDLSCLDNSINRAVSSNEIHSSNEKHSDITDTISKSCRIRGVETRLIYKTPNNDYIKSDESEYNNKYTTNESKRNPTSKPILSHNNYQEADVQHRNKRHTNSREKRDRAVNLSNTRPERHRMHKASSSVNIYNDTERDRRNKHGHSGYQRYQMNDAPDHIEKTTHGRRETSRREYQDTRDNECHKSRKKKHKSVELDEDFIADIIRRQYKPVKLFGRRLSDFSQFSAPVCRDQEFSPRADIEEDSELCSCCFEGHRRVSHRYCVKNDLSDMRSICDARLYSSKRHRRYKQAYLKDYNDSTVYDVVPVKEKTSPKSRRKFIEESMIPYDCYKEVPPSPRTNRPRLNLKAQYYDYDDNIASKKRQRNSPVRGKNHHELEEACEECSINSLHNIKRCDMPKMVPSKVNNLQDTSLQYSTACNDQTNLTNNDTLITQATGSTTNKADQALFEIKDILQSFLQEIKKESTSSDHSQISNKPSKPPDVQDDHKNNTTQVPFSGQNFNAISGMGHCSMPPPYMGPFSNPCCYPILPFCPINCTPNGYVVPSPSYTCTNCANASKDASCLNNKSNSNHNQPHPFDETQELIKEIYKVVAQSPKSPRYVNQVQTHVEKKILTSRSVGSSNASKRDVMVETPKMKCYSKSCEAIGSRLTTATCYSTTNPSYSDTVLEKLSLEVSDSSSESELDKDCIEKGKKHKFSKMLRKIGLFKRKKRDIIEEVSESESTVEVDVKPKHKPPFQQNIIDYSVHGQEYFRPPPVPDQRFCHVHDMPHRHSYGDEAHGPRAALYDACKHGPHFHDHSTPHYCRAPPKAAPPCCKYDYDPHYHSVPVPLPPESQPHHPQVPLCLKEIEVKSTGTQSERKISIFRKFKKTVQPPPTQMQMAQLARKQHAFSTQTPKDKAPLFKWKSFQEKARQASSNSDPMKFSLKTQKQLAEGDMKLRNAMVKKLFHKRNPFSPRNLIIRTLLGKDKSSFGDPPKMYRPRMFI